MGGEAIVVQPFQNGGISMTTCWDDPKQQFKCKDVTKGGGEENMDPNKVLNPRFERLEKRIDDPDCRLL